MLAINPNLEPLVFETVATVLEPLVLERSGDASEKDWRSRLFNLLLALVPGLTGRASAAGTSSARASGASIVSGAALLLRLPRFGSHYHLRIWCNLDKVLCACWRGGKRCDCDVSSRCGREVQCQRVHMPSSWIGESSDLGEKIHLEERRMKLDDYGGW